MTALPSPVDEHHVVGHGGSRAFQLLRRCSSNEAPREFPSLLLHPESSGDTKKRRRRPAGTPDPDAEVVALSPKTLMESDKYVCEICNQGFQRDQNLQMHRRHHKVPWKLLKKPTLGVHKRVYVCPELSCLHHDPSHALGDLVGIKKHYRRKHCTEKHWKCVKCSKGYAVQSDYKAHLKTCGTRGHCCDCGKVFSRVESFIEHQDNCSTIRQKTNKSDVGCERPLILQQHINRTSGDSVSQSSNTTQAIPLAHSATSDTTVDSTVVKEAAQRFDHILQPVWRIEGDQRNALRHVLLSKQRMQDLFSDAAGLASNVMEEKSRHELVSRSTSYFTSARKSLSLVPELSRTNLECLPTEDPDSVDTTAPSISLQLSMSPYKDVEVASGSACLLVDSSYNMDTKPSSDSLGREIMPLQTPRHMQPPSKTGEELVTVMTRDRGESIQLLGKDLTLSYSGIDTHPGRPRLNLADDIGNRNVFFNDFLKKGVSTPGLGTSESGLGGSNQADQRQKQKVAIHTEDLNKRPVSTTIEERHKSLQPSRSAPTTVTTASMMSISQHCQSATHVESATPSHDSRKDIALTRRQVEIAGNEVLFANSTRTLGEACRTTDKAQPACAAEGLNQIARQQAQTDLNTAWLDIAAARRMKDRARQEIQEAQEELARAEVLKREARERLQVASDEKSYADHVRSLARCEMEKAVTEKAEAEADVQKLREQAQAQVDEAEYLKSQAERATAAAAAAATSNTNASTISSHQQQQQQQQHSPPTFCCSCRIRSIDLSLKMTTNTHGQDESVDEKARKHL